MSSTAWAFILQLFKKNSMKLIIIIIAAILISFGCSSSRKATADLNGNWELVVFPYSTKTLDEIFAMKKPELQLENGRLSGNTGCNRINGTYTVSGNSIQFGPNLAMTKMGCPNYDENVFLEAFNKVNRYQLKNNELSLMHDSTLLISFAKH
jgi:heat shock protein HslJ